MHYIRKTLLITIFLFAFILVTSTIVTSAHYFGTNASLAYGQPDQMNSNTTNFVNAQDIPIKKVHVGDIDIAYKTFGKGEPILLISGSANVMDFWSPSMLQELSSNHTVIMFDNRRVGNTTSGSKPFSIQQFTNDTVRLLDALKIQKADVLGLSMGSFVAQGLTLMHPEKVNRLTLYAASCGGQVGIPHSPQVVKIFADYVRNPTQNIGPFFSVLFPPEWIKEHPDFPKIIPKTTEIVPHTTLIQQADVVEKYLATNWTGICSQLPNISNPTLIITGAEDISIPAANSLILVEKIPGAWLVQIKGTGHLLMHQYSEQFSSILQTFLSTT